MKKIIIFTSLICITLTSCSEDKEVQIDTSAKTLKKTAGTGVKGEIPDGMKVFSVFSNNENLSLTELQKLYIDDAKKSTGQDYEANLKNMWFVLINKKLLKEGTNEQREFFIKEQMALDNNLPHFKSFYKLLASASTIQKEERIKLSKAFYDKNKKAIGNIHWQSDEEKKGKETELLLAWRDFAIRIDL